MTVAFTIQTTVMAPPDRVFAASLSIDDHLASMAASGEQVVGGVTAGRIGPRRKRHMARSSLWCQVEDDQSDHRTRGT